MKKTIIISIILGLHSVAIAEPLALYPKFIPQIYEYVSTGEDIIFQLEAKGGFSPYTFSVARDQLPQSLSLDSKKGQISGKIDNTEIIDSSEKKQFRVFLEDANKNKVSVLYTLEVLAPVIIKMDEKNRCTTLNTTYFESLSISGGKGGYTVSVIDDNLPPGLSLTYSNYGIIEGTPKQKGDFSFNIHVTDSIGNETIEKFSITVYDELKINMDRLNDGCVGEYYEMFLTATGGSGVYTFKSSNLPKGLSIDQKNKKITGIPLKDMTFGQFYIEVIDSLNNKDLKLMKPFYISNKLTVSNLPDGIKDIEYSNHLPITGGIIPYSCTVYGNIKGVDFYPQNNYLFSGIPKTDDYYNLEVLVTDSTYPIPQTVKTYMNVVIYSQMIIENDPILPTAIAGEEIYPIKISIAGAVPELECNISPENGLPSNVYLDKATMTIKGTPLSSGFYKFKLIVTDNTKKTITKQFYWHIRSPLTIISSNMPEMVYKEPFNFTFEISGGAGSFLCSINETLLPEGISFNKQTCQFSGIVESHKKPFYLYLDVFDSDTPKQHAQETFHVITRNQEFLSISPTSLPPALSYNSYKEFFTSSAPNTDIQWNVISGSIPGLYFDVMGRSLVLHGHPDKPGIYSFEIKLSDRSETSKSTKQKYTLTVMESLKITTNLIDPVIIDDIYNQTIHASGYPPYVYSIESGQLPEGITLNSETGSLSGTSIQGESTFVTICVQESGYFKQKACKSFPMLVISDKEFKISVTQSGLARQFDPITIVFSGNGGARPYEWELPEVPEGLSVIIKNEQLIVSGSPSVCDQNKQFMINSRMIDQRQYVMSYAYGLDINCACDYKISGNLSHLPNIDVGLFTYNNDFVKQTSTDEYGNYSFKELDCNEYYVKPSAQRFLFIPERSPPVLNQNYSDLNFEFCFIDDKAPELFHAKAIIILGTKSQSYTVMQGIQEEITDALNERGFQKDIQYIIINDQSNQAISQIESAIKEWGSNASLLWIYLGGVVNENTLAINTYNNLSIHNLTEWLNNFGEMTKKRVITIAEGHSAKAFLSNINLHPHIRHIKIAAPYPTQATEMIWSYFSKFFWQYLSQKDANLADAYIKAKDERKNIDKFMLDVDNNSIENQTDISIAEKISLNGNVIDFPYITENTPETTLSSTNRLKLWVTVEPGSSAIEHVFAKQISLPLPENYPFVISDDYQTIEFQYNTSNGRYEADVSFDDQGVTYIVFWASDKEGYYTKPASIKIVRNEIYKAIIISGKRARGVTDNIQNAVQLNAFSAINTLEQLGFSPKDIYHLSAYEDIDEEYKRINYEMITNIDEIETKIKQVSEESDRMLIYMVDHGKEDKFFINNEKSVTSCIFKGWLENIDNNLPNGLLLIYDACYSGSFLNSLHDIKIKPFIRISSTSSDEKAVFHNDGTFSFSFQFWANIFFGQFNISKAFYNASTFLKMFENINQTPCIDIDGNNEWNEPHETSYCDFPISKLIKRDKQPEDSEDIDLKTNIVAPIDRAVLDISCEVDEVYNDCISEMFAVVHPPISSRSIQTFSPQLVMKREGSNFKATYKDALEEGLYNIYYIAKFNDGKQKLLHSKSIKQTSTVKKDDYEPDDKHSLSFPLDHRIQRSLHDKNDKDVMYFYAQKNQIYQIKTLRTKINPDMIISLNNSDLNKEVKWSVIDLENSAEWECETSGLYYLTVMMAEEEQDITSGEIYQIEVVFPDGTDAYENDYTSVNARTIDIDGRTQQTHTFHDKKDEDWIKFFGVKGQIYTISAQSIYTDQYLVIEIFDENMKGIDYINKRKQNKAQGKTLNCSKNGIYFLKFSYAKWEGEQPFIYKVSVFIALGGWDGGSISGRIYDTYNNDNPLSDVGIYINSIAEKPSSLSRNGWYDIYCKDIKGSVKLFAQKNHYNIYIGEAFCPSLGEVTEHIFYMDQSLKSIMELLKLQTGIESVKLPKDKDMYLINAFGMKDVLKFFSSTGK